MSKGFSISHLVVVAGLAIALLFPNLNRGGLSGYDDALYADEGKQMLRTGDWWTPHFNGQPNLEYPPVFIWLEAASQRAFGVNDYAAKLPSALAGLGTILVLYLLSVELTGDLWLATLAMFVLTTTQLFLKYATHAMTDVPFTFLVTLALYLYVRGLSQRWYFMLAGISIAAAILTRSIIGVFPLGVMAAHMLLTRRYRMVFSPEFAAMLIIALGLPSAWLGFPPRPEHVAFVAGKVEGGSNWLEYGWLILRFYWPWLPFLVVGAAVEVRARKLLPLLWCVCLIVPLSVASTKYARYLIPAFPAMAMITAAGIDRLVPLTRRALAFRAACGVLLVVAGFTFLFPAKERGMDMRMLAPVAERNTEPSEHVLLYTMGGLDYDTQNQLLWYGSRYTTLTTDLAALESDRNATLIIDKASFDRLKSSMPPPHMRLLGESEKFVCVRID